ncbi:MAG: right-handed parallel beta-helix repeat-containing protein [Candidatus Rokubacteria bacterium]|nr:right-handed parallel beta-helix repeat-containing protein [Candidatus Rokubacteria bacterium]
MMPRAIRLLLFLTLILSPALTIAVLPVPAEADTRLVDCSRGRRIATALRVPAGRSLMIRISGICTENVVIARDDVTLVAGVAGATINATDPTKNTIQIDGAKGVVIDGLHVTGARNGIVGQSGASFVVQNAFVHNNAQSGIVALGGSTVTVTNTEMTANGATGDVSIGTNGITVVDNSTAYITGGSVSGNSGSGIVVTRSSAARVGRTVRFVPGPVTISGNGARGGSGVSVTRNSYALVDGNTITTNTGSGISLDQAASATITTNRIEGNTSTGISVTNTSAARIGLDERNTAPRREDGFTNVIRDNDGDGISVSYGANANFYGNLIELNGGRGVSVARASAGSFGDNRIRDNVRDGVGVFGSKYSLLAGFGLAPNPDFITNNGTGHDPSQAWGVIVFDGGSARMDNAEITGNFLDGIMVGDASMLDIRNSTVSSNTRNGISAMRGASVDLRSSTVSSNGASGVILSTGTAANVQGSTISTNSANGILATTGSSVTVTSSTISDNGTAGPDRGNGINLFVNSSANVSDSVIERNSRNGIEAHTNSTANVSNTTSSPLMIIQGHTSSGSGQGIIALMSSAVRLFRGFLSNGVTLVAPVTITGNRVGISCFLTSVMESGDALQNPGGGASGISLNTSDDLLGTTLVSTEIVDAGNVPRTVLAPAALTAEGGNCL